MLIFVDDGPAQDVDVPVKASLPVVVAEDRDGGVRIIGRHERSSERRFDAQHIEVAARRPLPHHPLGTAVDDERQTVEGERGKTRKGVAPIAHDLVAWIRRRAPYPAVGPRDTKEEQLTRLADRNRLEQDRVDETEDGEVGTNAETDRDQRDRGETGGAAQ